MKARFEKCSDGWERSGVDQPRATLHHLTREWAVFKVPGRTYWRGIGIERGYAGVDFQVVKIDEHEARYVPERIVGEIVVDFPQRAAVEAQRGTP